MKYISILLVVLVLITNFFISCSDEEHGKEIHQESMHFDTTYFQKNPCPIFKCDEEIKQMEQNLDKIKIELEKRK